jgi:hypothetical protein
VARALSDGAQSLNLDELAKLMKGLSAPIRSVAKVGQQRFIARSGSDGRRELERRA